MCTTLIQDLGKVATFIETLTDSELVMLWKTVNTPEYIGLIASQLQDEVTKELDESMSDIASKNLIEEVIEETQNDVQ